MNDITDPLYFFDIKKKVLLELTERKSKLLKLKEDEWRLKSRSEWAVARDNNTRYFDSVASKRKRANTICKIWSKENTALTEQMNIQGEAVHFFSIQYRTKEEENIAHQMEFANLFPCIMSKEANELMDRPIAREELPGVMKAMERGKGLGPDG